MAPGYLGGRNCRRHSRHDRHNAAVTFGRCHFTFLHGTGFRQFLLAGGFV